MDASEDRLERLREGISTLIRVLKVREATAPPDGKSPLNPTDSQALMFIANQGETISTHVASFLGTPATTVSALVDRLVKRGLVSRSRTEQNRRVVLLSLTELGQQTAEHMRQEELRKCARLLEILPEPEQQSFVTHISQLAQALDAKAEAEPWSKTR